MPRFLRPFAALALAGLLGPGTALATDPSAPTKRVAVTVIADVTGAAGAYGTSQKNAFELAAEDLRAGRIDAGGAALSFDVRDSASDPARAVELVRQATRDGSALLVGPTLSGEAKQADPIAVNANLTVLGTSNAASGITSLGPCVFRDALAEEQIVPEVVDRTAARWHLKTAAIVYGDDNRFTKSDFGIFKAALERRHVAVVDAEPYRTGELNFKPLLSKVAAKKPDVLVVASLLAEGVRIVVQAREARMPSHIIGGYGLNSPKFIALAGNTADGVVIGSPYFAGNAYAGNAAFAARYQRRFGVTPDPFSAQAYAAAQILAAIAKRGARDSGAFCRALRDATQIPTVVGPVAFTASRDVRGAAAVLQVASDSFVYF